MWRGEAITPKGVVAHWLFTDRSAVTSSPDATVAEDCFAANNLADHVGDDLNAVVRNRAAVLSTLGLQPQQAVWPEFCHSSDFAVVRNPGSVGKVDGLITDQVGIALVTLGADCVPLLAIEPERGLAVSAHIGWQGAAKGIARKLVEEVEKLGGQPAQMQFWLGPAICGDCYQVPAERRAEVSQELPSAPIGSGLDLRLGLSDYFLNLGAQVKTVGPCTKETSTLYSYRRDGRTGRQAGIVVLL